VLACISLVLRCALQSFLKRCEFRLAVLALGLLFAQLGAISHAYAHDAANSVCAHHSGADSHAAANSHDLCNDCLAYAPLLAAAGTPVSLPLIEVQRGVAHVNDTCASRVDLTLTLAFRSRAPPYRA
jgi:hypothetical protein